MQGLPKNRAWLHSVLELLPVQSRLQPPGAPELLARLAWEPLEAMTQLELASLRVPAAVATAWQQFDFRFSV